MPHSSNFNIEKLLGRENYNSWSFAVKNYLQHDKVWDTVQGIYPAEGINDAESAKEVWDKLKAAFQDSGLTRRVRLLRQLITTRLESSENIEDYVSKIVSTAHKLKEIEMPNTDEWVETLLLAGLPDEYAPMIMGIESSGTKISCDSIKTKLFQDVKKTVTPKKFQS